MDIICSFSRCLCSIKLSEFLVDSYVRTLSQKYFYDSFSFKTGNSERPVSFESRGHMGEELDSLRATVDEQPYSENNSTSMHATSARRRKRFLSYPRYVELMVTADAKMARHHGGNLEHYILTIMSVVSKIMFLKKFFLFFFCYR